MYLGTSDIIYLAEELVENWRNGNISFCVSKIKELNPIQAMYVFGLFNGLYVMNNSPILSKRELDSLMNVLSQHLNDKE